MRRRLRAILVNSICMLAGIALGGTVVGLWGQRWESEWVEAYGTWFGAIATVLALLWAVQTFRADQAHRQAQIDGASMAERDAKTAEQRELASTASRVSIELRGGAGYGAGNPQMMTSLHVVIHNDTNETVVVFLLRVNEPLVVQSEMQSPIRVQPFETWRQLVQIAEVPVDPSVLSDRPLLGGSAVIHYAVRGRTWERTTAGESPQLLR